MATADRYTRAIESTHWGIPSSFDTTFNWEYETGRPAMQGLYAKAKRLQWNADDRIDWSQDLDPENPMELPDESVLIYGSPVWSKLDRKQRAQFRHHQQAWQISQFLHGEQGALVCTAKIVQQVPDMDAKYYAATQVVDEARHVEVFSRLLHDKFELVYPITAPLGALLGDVLRDSRWDMTYLGMQVLVEGLALASFQQIRDGAKNGLAAQVNAYVMQDEARHVAFGRLALRDYYPQLTEKERDEREEFVVEGCYLMRDRFLAPEIAETLGLPVAECAEYVARSELMRSYRSALFSRIVPTIKEIGSGGLASARPTPTWASSASRTWTARRWRAMTSRSLIGSTASARCRRRLLDREAQERATARFQRGDIERGDAENGEIPHAGTRRIPIPPGRDAAGTFRRLLRLADARPDRWQAESRGGRRLPGCARAEYGRAARGEATVRRRPARLGQRRRRPAW